MNRYWPLLLIVFLLNMVSVGFAEIVLLQNGKTVRGKIKERTDDYIKIMVKGIPHMYFKEEIKEIKEDIPVNELLKAQTKPLRKISEIPDSKMELIRNLMEINGTAEGMEVLYKDINTRLSAQDAAALRELVETKEILEEIIPVYDKYYTEEELVTLIKFYDSDLGRKIIQVSPGITQDTMDITIQYFEKRAKELDSL